jgi:hypothetical protein
MVFCISSKSLSCLRLLEPLFLKYTVAVTAPRYVMMAVISATPLPASIGHLIGEYHAGGCYSSGHRCGLLVADTYTRKRFQNILKSFIRPGNSTRKLSNLEQADIVLANNDGQEYSRRIEPLLQSRGHLDLRCIPDFHGMDVCWGTMIWHAYIEGDTSKFMREMDIILPEWRLWL